MKREIYEVVAKVVDASGAYNNLTGFPQSFDSHHYNDDLDKAWGRAYAAYHSACTDGANGFANGRPLTIATLLRVSDGLQLEKSIYGKLPELPDPLYTVTVNNGTGSGDYLKDEIVNIVANAPAEGKQFSEWDGADGLVFTTGNATTATAEFKMPANAVTLTAVCEDI